ncbi:type IV pilus assembly protein PilM [Candidatus Saccharibacteria bacterium]|nr:type IV pilus assembly protein PilM [Candidatus Saccharibacteria bacterium]
MKLLRGVGDFFAIDVGTNSIRIVQLNGDARKGWSLYRYAYAPVDEKLIQDSSELGRKKFQDVLKSMIKEAQIRTKNVAIGLPADRTFTAVVEVDAQDDMKALQKTVQYSIEQYIPMPIDEAKADFRILGPSPNGTSKVDVLVSSTAVDYAERTLDLYEGVGLNVVAMEPEPLAMARALMPVGANDARMIVDLGERATDLVVVYRGAPRLVRSIPGGFNSLVKAVSSGLSVKDEQARQFILKFGLAQDKIEGQVFKALDSTLESFAGELSKSVLFFQGKYTSVKIGGIVLSGFAEIIPFIAEYIEAKTDVPTMQGNPWQMVRVSSEQQSKLMSVANEFAVAIGLAERSNE